MIQSLIPGASPFDRIRRTRPNGTEFWSARELQPVMGYAAWRDFANAVDRAKAACANSGHHIADHFADARKVAASGPDAEDFVLTRYGAYLVAMNGDPRKREIADAQTYFAIKTREAELREQFELPRTFAEALELAAQQARRLEQAENRTAAAEHQAAQLAPAARAFDVFLTTAGDYDAATAAKFLCRDAAINTGQRRLLAFMDSIGWTYKHGSQPRGAYQRHVDLGRLVMKPTSYRHHETGVEMAGERQVRITVKGLFELHKLLGGRDDLRVLMEQGLAA